MISVIIPTYNSAKTLPKCLESVFRQSKYCKLDVIVVDDCSTDDTQTVTACFPGVRYIRNSVNSGAHRSRLNGLKIACGHRTMFVDSDDWLQPDAFRTLTQSDADIVCADFRYRLTCLNLPYRFDKFSLNGKVDKAGITDTYTQSAFGRHDLIPVSVCAKLFNTAMLQAIDFPEYDCFWGEDRVFMLFAMQEARSMYCINKSVYNYRWGGNSRNVSNDMLRQFIYWHNAMEKYSDMLDCRKFMPIADEELHKITGYYIRNRIMQQADKSDILNMLQDYLGISQLDATTLYDKEYENLKHHRLRYFLRKWL